MAKEQKKPDNSEDTEVESGEEPSMEDILKSIRGVISGEDEEGDASDGADADADSEDDDILELTEMAEEEPPTEENKEEAEEATEAKDMTEAESEDVAAAAADPAEAVDEGGGDDDKSVLDNIDDALGEGEEGKDDGGEDSEDASGEASTVEEETAVEADEGSDEVPAEESGEDNDDDDGVLEAEGAEEGSAVEAAADDYAASERLIKDKVADESSQTLKTLVANLPKTQIDSPYTAGGITLEQLTIEAMRPFLAEWLNENLPVIVKQIVTKEIKKLIPEEDDK